MPGRKTLQPAVSLMICAPCSPQRSRSWPRPWLTMAIWMPRPPASAMKLGMLTGAMLAISSRAISSGGSSRRPGIRLPAILAV